MAKSKMPTLAGLIVTRGKVSHDRGDSSDDEDTHEYDDDEESDDGGDEEDVDREMAKQSAKELIDAMKSEDADGIVDAIEAIVRSCK
jgi:hypothetical protein